MKDVEKIREGLYIKKSFDGYRVVHPIKNDDGTFNWFNILTGGNYWMLVKFLIILFLILAMTWSYAHDTKACRELMENPCELLPNITDFCIKLEEQPIQSLQINLEDLQFDK